MMEANKRDHPPLSPLRGGRGESGEGGGSVREQRLQ